MRTAVLLAVVLLLLPMPVSAQEDVRSVTDLWPAPGQVVPADPLRLAAQVQLPDAAVVSLMVEGKVVAYADAAAGQVVALEGTAAVTAGPHVASVLADGEPVATWRFTAAGAGVVTRTGPDLMTLALDLARTQAQARAQGTGGRYPSAVLVGQTAVPDALAGVPAASAVAGPLLVTSRDELPALLAEGMQQLLAPDATVHILGGPAAVDERVAQQVSRLGFQVIRHAGDGRVDTAAAAASLQANASTVVLVGQDASADAATASVLAAVLGAPILLTARDELSRATARHLTTHRPDRVIIVGGEAVVSSGIQTAIESQETTVERIAGPDRANTAAMVGARLPIGGAGGGVAVSGTGDAMGLLLAAADSAREGVPLLLSDGGRVPSTAIEVASERPDGPVVVHGEGVSDPVVTALHTALGGRSAGLRETVPAFGTTVAFPGWITVRATEPLDLKFEGLRASVDGVERDVTMSDGGAPSSVTVSTDLTGTPPTRSATLHLHGVVRTVTGRQIAVDWHGTVGPAVLPYAVAAGVALLRPAEQVILIGYHQSSNRGGLDQEPADPDVPSVVMESRGRGTGARSAADIVVPVDTAIVSPVDGVIDIAQRYELYCRYPDEWAKIIPDAAPHLRLDILHMEGLQVHQGDRVVAGETVLATSARPLPFDSQVDDHVPQAQRGDEPHPHVHVQLVDPSVAPTTPPSPC